MSIVVHFIDFIATSLHIYMARTKEARKLGISTRIYAVIGTEGITLRPNYRVQEGHSFHVPLNVNHT